MAQNLTRNKNITFRVSDNEYEMIKWRMGQRHINNMRAYLLKMAIDGKVIDVETDSIRECGRLLSNISNNVNQIAKRVNEGGNVYAVDLQDIQTRLSEVWEQQNKIVKILSEILEGV